MAFQKLTNGARAISLFRVGAALEWTVSQWYTKLDWDDADAVNLGNAIIDTISTYLVPVMTTITEVVSVTVYDQREEAAPKYTITPIAPLFGTDASSTAPINSACCLTYRTNSRGRSARGRNYFGGFAEDQISADLYTSTITDAVESFGANLRVNALAEGWQQVIASFQQNKVPLDPGVAREVTSSEVRSAIATTQRRRIPRP